MQNKSCGFSFGPIGTCNHVSCRIAQYQIEVLFLQHTQCISCMHKIPKWHRMQQAWPSFSCIISYKSNQSVFSFFATNYNILSDCQNTCFHKTETNLKDTTLKNVCKFNVFTSDMLTRLTTWENYILYMYCRVFSNKYTASELEKQYSPHRERKLIQLIFSEDFTVSPHRLLLFAILIRETHVYVIWKTIWSRKRLLWFISGIQRRQHNFSLTSSLSHKNKTINTGNRADTER